ncbi:putative serine/threonineprotein kinase/receptor [Paratrimastix pyriformis]|uniref:Serine/threonineprotein kinase/receptor n=1 Tax=Paratrimastix pyriformis TaxID=342808 RepID=A0ABQ8U8P2_9EUKA|nr:putative serine/threonineprotein kinase/receptor [Paratrimastix pyriformis]
MKVKVMTVVGNGGVSLEFTPQRTPSSLLAHTQVATVDFANLKIIERVGHGAAGEVFKGDLNGTTVAVKVSSESLAKERLFDTSETEAQMTDFRREVALMRTLRHPYIVALIGATFNNPKLIITEYMGRGSLYNLLHDETVPMSMELRLRMAFDMARASLHALRSPIMHRDRETCYVFDITYTLIMLTVYARLSFLHALRPPIMHRAELPARPAAAHHHIPTTTTMCSVCAGLSFLHALRPPIMHRDIKSQNMLVTDDLRVKVSDFGISRLSQESIHTAAGTPVQSLMIISCPPYLTAWSAPEVLRGEPSWLPSDVYSFGVVLWELVTRQTPWEGIPALQVMNTVSQGARPPIPERGCPPELADLMRDCWAQAPEARPTFEQVRQSAAPPNDLRPSGAG